MSKTRVCIRIVGELNRDVKITIRSKYEIFYRGEVRYNREPQPIDVIIVELFEIQDSDIITADTISSFKSIFEDIDAIINKGEHIIKRKELYISSIRYTEQGGFSLPSELMAEIGKIGLSLGVSILALVDDDNNDDDDNDNNDS